MSITNSTPLAILLTQLEAAVRGGDRVRATELAQIILQCLAAETADRANVERQVRALLAELDEPESTTVELTHEIFVAERGVDLLEGVDSAEIVAPAEGVSSAAVDELTDAVYPVWFGTNRKPAADGVSFTNQRHGYTTLGRALVHIPQAHRFGETGNGFWRRLLRFDFRDDRLRMQSIEQRERDAFFTEIQDAIAAARETHEDPQALVFLHGFNVTFEEAAIRAAQIGFDLQVPGATAFFSWPSRGSVTAYPADEATIEASERAITEFLVSFAAHCGTEKVHVIAHSMGNRGLLRSLQRIAANAETRGKVKFGQIFLAAPDIDRDLFLDLAHLYPEHGEHTTLYTSDGDKAVHLSARLHDAPRAGYFAPYTVAEKIDMVAVPDFDVDLLGHGYFSQAEALLHDIYELMRHGTPPPRQRMEPLAHDGLSFWRFRR
jgi:esterase/lipase superfamily enzyme